MEHIWNQTNFVENLKKYVEIDIDEMCPSPLTATSPTSMDDPSTNQKVVLLNRDNLTSPEPITDSRVVAKRKYLLNNNILPKPKKPVANMKGRDHEKYSKKISNKSQSKTDPFKKGFKINGKLPKENDSMGGVRVTGYAPNDGRPTLSQDFANCTSSSSSSTTPTSTTMGNGTKVLLNQREPSIGAVTSYECEDPSIRSLPPKLDMNQKEHSVANVVALLSSSSDILMAQAQATNNNPTPSADYVNIIDNCFFVDDTLNCNVLHSPFSSDNDVDGFIIANSNEGSASNKELLNKFHDRLEEMEEKIDNAEYKLYWNGESDEDNMDDAIHGADDEDEVGDGQDDTSAEFAGMIATKQQYNEFV